MRLPALQDRAGRPFYTTSAFVGDAQDPQHYADISLWDRSANDDGDKMTSFECRAGRAIFNGEFAGVREPRGNASAVVDSLTGVDYSRGNDSAGRSIVDHSPTPPMNKKITKIKEKNPNILSGDMSVIWRSATLPIRSFLALYRIVHSPLPPYSFQSCTSKNIFF